MFMLQKNYQQNWWNVKYFLIDTNFLTTAKISLFHCCKKVFTIMNILVFEKNSMEHHYLKKNFYSHLNLENITYADYGHRNRVCKDFEVKSAQYHD